MGVAGRLDGCRVLVVEDEAMIAALIESILAEAGCAVVGPVSTVGRALETIDGNGWLDLAVLDVCVNGCDVYPVADRLRERGIPVVFVSGFSLQDMPPSYRGNAHLTKPFQPDAMIALVAAALRRGRVSGSGPRAEPPRAASPPLRGPPTRARPGEGD